jgi:hypothetical protein
MWASVGLPGLSHIGSLAVTLVVDYPGLARHRGSMSWAGHAARRQGVAVAVAVHFVVPDLARNDAENAVKENGVRN